MSEPNWRSRALAAEDAIRDLIGMLQEIDNPEDQVVPAGYVGSKRAQEAVRRSMRNRQYRRPNRKVAR